ncbi:type I-E CRISPR-associated protein Cas7/Cse4/CasC [Methylicorpusculum sp.]|uniref:type I-E CRISPR-associated protein Cas7/Cse4/CasC n=1 Tax=Methylicorpusculum sp. TaxID=2713644 RepID=UPI00272F44C2|nr:type I-E CRISPR-associated protein Cas7/Cse4/CasC [Methylicorpusculum sp.]MDP2176922.1 type I-E CRISPR-associated protein Cas7/Cse4/CasC [Methylicorpusculum sp.]MDP3528692.1 type I-E CRISPR-associated protein Cas7/Cse4/CasC [Methylicorpusculum sp.]MDZ4150924.1 type I-E CRISPR-associated protein Cas7/Cse4/CasC [Methylicorpusculum sp.]
MSRFLQLHLLTAYPPANLNRDDQGSPKTAKMGGYDRLRVSSQCLKRTWRTSDHFQQALSGHIGTRTKQMGVKLYDYLTSKGVDHATALEWSKPIAGVFGKLKQLSKKEKDEKKELVEVEIEQLAFFDSEEEKSIFALADKLIERGSAPVDDELKFLRQKVSDVDIALFGRMLASSPAFNIEAACQVAHAISVHPVVIEDDYFTAVDDLNNGLEDMGAAHIGETRFAAGLFYSYLCINRELLIDNLGGDEALANKAIRALTEAVVKVAPEGKQNSFATRAYASFVLAEKGDQQPRSLSVAYLKPIMDRESNDFVADSIHELIKQKDNFDKVYGECADARYELNVPEVKGCLSELLNFVGQ